MFKLLPAPYAPPRYRVKQPVQCAWLVQALLLLVACLSVGSTTAVADGDKHANTGTKQADSVKHAHTGTKQAGGAKQTDTGAKQADGDKQADIDTKDEINWQLFSPTNREFTVMIPGAVAKRIVKYNGLPVTLYDSTGGEPKFTVSSLTLDRQPDSFSNYVNSVTIKLDHPPGRDDTSSAQEEEMSGQGWTGTKLKFLVNKVEKHSALIVRINNTDIVYLLTVAAPSTSEIGRKFLNSFAVDIKIAKEVHNNDTDPLSYKILKTTIYLVIPGLLMAWFLIIKMRTPMRK